MRRLLLIFIFGILLLSGAGFFLLDKIQFSDRKSPSYLKEATSSAIPKKVNLEEIAEIELTPEELERYSQVYKNPFVIYLRKALNAYLANDTTSVYIPIIAIEKNVGKIGEKEIISGLEAFDKEYYKSKFIVVTINNSIGGGRDIQIIFQDKPDRIFYAWVYQLSNGEFELRGFNSKEHFDEEEMEVLRKIYRKYLNSPEYAL